MSIEGSINVSALFHDKDGTTTMKVVSLRSANEYTTGKVAIVTGTAGTATLTLGNIKSTTFRNAEGELVSFGEIDRVAFRFAGAKRVCTVTSQFDGDDYGSVALVSSGGVAVSEVNKSGLAQEADANYAVTIARVFQAFGSSDTGTYTIVIYGT